MNSKFCIFATLALLGFLPATALESKTGDSERGRQVFTAANCSMCHVGGGNMICPEKPLKGAGFQKRYPKDSMIADVIRHGVPGTVMDRFGKDKLSDNDLQDVVAYIRSLSAPGNAGKAKTPASQRAIVGGAKDAGGQAKKAARK